MKYIQSYILEIHYTGVGGLTGVAFYWQLSNYSLQVHGLRGSPFIHRYMV